jgi:DNA topoisomerase VI subunit B
MSAVTWPRTCDTLTKWVPSQPTSPHWYTVERLQALLAAYLAEDRRQGRRRTVREVVAEFDGLSGSVAQRQVVEGAQLHRATLEDLVRGECLDTPVVTRLLKAMQDRARPVLPAVLGLIGEAHLRKQLIEHYGVEATSITYKKYADSADGIPYILELALGWYPDCRASAGRTTLLGYNFTPALRMPFQELPNLYVAAAVDYRDPVVLAVHLTSPRLDATDRGKTAVVLPPAVTEALAEGMQAVSKRWQKLKKALEREGHAALRAEQERRRHDRQLSVKEGVVPVSLRDM